LTVVQSAQRKQLADRIAELNRLQRQRDQLDAASSPAWEEWSAAAGALDRARESVEQATQDAVSHRIAVLAGDGDEPEPPPSVEDARQKVRICEDQLAAARMARDEIESRSDAVGRVIPNAQHAVRDAARSVFIAETLPLTNQLIADAQQAQQAYLRAVAPLVVLSRVVPRHDADEALRAVHEVVDEVYRNPAGWACASPGPPHGPENWSELLAALERDASAKLPK